MTLSEGRAEEVQMPARWGVIPRRRMSRRRGGGGAVDVGSMSVASRPSGSEVAGVGVGGGAGMLVDELDGAVAVTGDASLWKTLALRRLYEVPSLDTMELEPFEGTGEGVRDRFGSAEARTVVSFDLAASMASAMGVSSGTVSLRGGGIQNWRTMVL